MAGNIADNAGLVFHNVSDVTFGNTITGTGNLTAAGPANLALTQTSFAGNITIAGGCMSFGNFNLTGGSLTVQTGGTANVASGAMLSGACATTVAGCLTGSGSISTSLSVASGGTLAGNLTVEGANLAWRPAAASTRASATRAS